MLAQRRIVTLVNLLAMQGAVLFVATLLLAWRTGEHHLYLSAALTLALKVVLLPWLLHRLIRRLKVYWDTEPLLNISGTMLVGVLVVVFAFGLAQPISALANTATRNSIGIAVAVILLSFVTMITRRKAMSQVVGFLSMENGLFFGAMSATYGMPMIVEFGVALDVLVAVLVLGVFFFQIREQFDSLDLHHLESLKESHPLYQAEFSPHGSQSVDPTGSQEDALDGFSATARCAAGWCLAPRSIRRAALGPGAQRRRSASHLSRRLRAHRACRGRRPACWSRASSSSSIPSTSFSSRSPPSSA